MASSSPSVLVFLCLFLVCQASLLHDPAMPSASSPSPARDHQHHRHHHRRHHHHRHHQASGGPQQAGEGLEGVEGVDVVSGKAQRRKDGQAEGVEKQGSPQGVSHRASGEDGDLSRVEVSTPETASAPPARIMSAEKIGHDEPAEESVQRAAHEEPTARPPAGEPHDPQLSPASTPHPEPASSTTTPPKKPRQAGIADQQRSEETTTAVDTSTDRNERPLSRHVDNDGDKEDENRPHNPPVPEIPDQPGDDKRSNRPRLRHTLLQNDESEDSDDAEIHHQRPGIKDNSSRNRLRQKKPVPPGADDPQPDPESASSGPSPHPDPVLKQRDRNRPGWDSPEDNAEGSESGSDPSPGEQKAHRGTALPPKAKGDKEQEKRVRRKKAKVAKAANAKKVVKEKKKKKSKALLKGCPGCTQAELKQAKARELHKQVLKAQLLDKLRLVPTFQKQPWPPKLPDQVFPDLTQSDQGLHEDRYYARPTQLLLLGHDLGPRHRLKKAATGTYRFKVGGKVKGAVRSAQLWVYKMKDANDAHEQTLVITELQRTKRRRLRERSLVARLDTRVREGWVTFDVTSLVNRWIENETPASLQLLAIRCKTCHRTSYRAIFGVKSHFHPVLVIREAQEGRGKGREQRSQCDPTNGCCKFDLTVTFEELGIHEIFRPLSIKADYCYGTCERPDAFHYNHTMIMQHMRFNSHVSNSTLRQRLQPCCVPVVLREATIYHYFNAGLDSQVSLVPNLLVDRCGCA